MIEFTPDIETKVPLIDKLKAEYAHNGPSAAFTLYLNKSIIEWIVTHIRSADKELGKFLNRLLSKPFPRLRPAAQSSDGRKIARLQTHRFERSLMKNDGKIAI